MFFFRAKMVNIDNETNGKSKKALYARTSMSIAFGNKSFVERVKSLMGAVGYKEEKN